MSSLYQAVQAELPHTVFMLCRIEEGAICLDRTGVLNLSGRWGDRGLNRRGLDMTGNVYVFDLIQIGCRHAVHDTSPAERPSTAAADLMLNAFLVTRHV